MTSGSPRGQWRGEKELGCILLCALAVGSWAVWTEHPLQPVRVTDLPGVSLLNDSQMSAVVGGFDAPKGNRVCCIRCQQAGNTDGRCTAGEQGGSGTHAPQVTPATGNVSDSVDGPTVQAVGGGLNMKFHYDSDLADGTNASLNLGMAYGWTHTYENSLMESGANMAWLQGDGAISYFKRVGPVFIAMSGEFATLTRVSSTVYEIRLTNGSVHRYDVTVSGQWPGVRHLLRRTTDRNGLVTTYSYDAQNRLTSVIDPWGHALTYQYDAQNRLTIVNDPLGRVTTLSYDASGNLGSIRPPDGSVYTYEYNTLRQMTRKILTDPCPPGLIGGHPGDSNPTAQSKGGSFLTNDLGSKRPSTSASGERNQRVGPCPPKELYTLTYDDSAHKVTGMTDMSGNDLYRPAAPGNWSVNYAQSLTSGEMTYTPGTSSIADGNGRVWRYTYDAHGLVTQLEAPLVGGQPAITRYEYDPGALRPTKVTDPLGRETRYQYDTYGNMTRMTDPMGNVTQYSYSHSTVHNLMTERIEPDGDTWQWQYDAGGNLIQEIDPEHGPGGPFTTYTYDANGRRLSMTDRNGHTTLYSYDANSRLTQWIVDPGSPSHLNLTTTFTYDAVGNRVQTVDPRGNTTTFEYDARDRLTRTTHDPGSPPHLNHVTQYEYDGRDNRTAVTDPRGRTTTYEYDSRNRPTTMIDANGNASTTAYDGNGNRTSSTDPNGRVTRYEYDTRDRLTRRIDDSGSNSGNLNIITRYDYDAADNRIRQTREVAPVDGSPRVTEYQYDSLNRVIRETRDPGGLGLTTQYDYAPPGGGGCGCNGTPGSSQVHRTIDPEGKITFYYYDRLDRKTSTVDKVADTADNEGDADDAITRATYDSVGNVIESRMDNAPASDRVVIYQYDAADRRTLQTVAPGADDLNTESVYDGNGNVIRRVEPNGNVTTTIYDAADRPTSQVDSIGLISTTAYDGNGNVTSRTDGNGNTTSSTYDSLNRRTTDTDPLGRTTTYQYDNMYNIVRITDGNGHVSTMQYDGVYRQTRRVRAATGGTDAPLNLTTEFTYDAAGNQRTIEAHNQNQGGPQVQITEYQYDAANRMIREIYPDVEDARPHQREFIYDGVGRVLRRTDQNGDQTIYAYDDLHRLTQRSYLITPGSPTYPSSQLPDTFTYDRTSQMMTSLHHAEIPDPDVMESFAYDGVGRVIQATQNGRTIQYDYQIDTGANRRDITYPSGRVIREAYDVRDRLSHLSDRPSDAPIADRLYNAGNRLTSQAYPNGTTTLYTYDELNRTIRLLHGNGGGPFIDLRYGYDAVGNPLHARHVHALDTSEWYRYDAADRLIDFKRGVLAPDNSDVTTYTPLAGVAQRRQWTLDDVGNWLINQARTGDVEVCEERFAEKANEYTSLEPGQPCPPGGGAPKFMSYDDNGNTAIDPSAGPAGVGLHYDYDIENRLTRVIRLSDGMVISRYFYDAVGRRIRKDVSNSGALDGTTEYLLNGRWQTIAEYDGTGILLREYVFGTGPDDAVALDRNLNADGTAIGPGDQRIYYHRDRLGSAYALTDSLGTVQESYLYDAYGSPIIFDGAGAILAVTAYDNSQLFTGREFDAETHNYQWRARYLDPALGRFESRDPLEYIDGPDLYAYVNDRPRSLLDPLGLKIEICCRALRAPVGKKHCYIKWSCPGNPGSKPVIFGLYPQSVYLRTEHYTADGVDTTYDVYERAGFPRLNDPRDSGGDCVTCRFDRPDTRCGRVFALEECQKQLQCLYDKHRAYPVGYYFELGPNSNTYAGTLARSCCARGLADAPTPDAPGYDDQPPSRSETPRVRNQRPLLDDGRPAEHLAKAYLEIRRLEAELDTIAPNRHGPPD